MMHVAHAAQGRPREAEFWLCATIKPEFWLAVPQGDLTLTATLTLTLLQP